MIDEDIFTELLANTKDMRTDATRDIEKDVPRSMPEEAFFQTEKGKNSLRNVLRAYSFRNPLVGYTQV